MSKLNQSVTVGNVGSCLNSLNELKTRAPSTLSEEFAPLFWVIEECKFHTNVSHNYACNADEGIKV